MRRPAPRAGGFTLVEIAIVLVIIGLLLGGILKGQELINNAKVRALSEQVSALRVAWSSFVDRYEGLPGDHPQAEVFIVGTVNGAGDGTIHEQEVPLVFQHLTASGFLRCAQCTETASALASPTNSLVNNYGGVMSIWHERDYYSARASSTSTLPLKLMIHTGPRIPSSILAEIDRKSDDGSPVSGELRFNLYDSQRDFPLPGDCMKVDAAGDEPGVLISTGNQLWQTDGNNCGASLNIELERRLL